MAPKKYTTRDHPQSLATHVLNDKRSLKRTIVSERSTYSLGTSSKLTPKHVSKGEVVQPHYKIMKLVEKEMVAKNVLEIKKYEVIQTYKVSRHVENLLSELFKSSNI